MTNHTEAAHTAAKTIYRDRWIAAGTPPFKQFWNSLTFVDRFKAYQFAFDIMKPKKKSYMVEGGVYTDATFSEVEPDTAESYGPFDNYDDALHEWRRRSFTPMIDNCYHRITIKEI